MGNEGGIDRREFLKGAAAAAILFTTKDLFAADAVNAAEAAAFTGPAVKVGVVGLGVWGKDVLATLSRLPSVQVTAICDTYEPFVKRAVKVAEKAATFADYKQMLASPDVEAVVIATPTHQHKEIVLAALQAGKHVYCEAPLASTIEDAKAIAAAAKGSKQVFQAGIQGRSNTLYEHVGTFVKSNCLDKIALVHGQWNKKTSWRRPAPTDEREKETNWRLDKALSIGLVGEQGIHNVDLVNRYLNALPVAVSGFGSIMAWNDGRAVPDTVQCVIEYPGNVRMIYNATLASSFGGDYTVFQGSDSSLLMKETRSWMIKEADSPLLGWEVYAHKEEIFGETGICMRADATKIKQEEEKTEEAGAVEPTQEPLYIALDNFARNIRGESKPACGILEGYQSTVVAIKANEAIMTGNKIAFDQSLFEI